jgi:hypothetical protein
LTDSLIIKCLILLTVFPAGCASNTPQPTTAPAVGATEGVEKRIREHDWVPEEEAGAEDVALREAIDEAVAKPDEIEDLWIFAECRRDAGMESLEIFGNGVGIWNNRRQFEITRDQVSQLLAAFQQFGFAALPTIIGGPEDPREQSVAEGEPEGLGAIQIICRVAIELEGQSKQVAQRKKGEQSAELKSLAEELFFICEEPARSGVAAESLRDGLEKISSGALVPETFRLTLNRKPELQDMTEDSSGFLLRLDGLTAMASTFSPGEGYVDPRVLELSAEDLRELTGTLAALDPAGLPINLYAPEYTDLTIEVLRFRKNVQARQFAGITPTTHGESQKVFDQLFQTLEALYQRVIDRGGSDT